MTSRFKYSQTEIDNILYLHYTKKMSFSVIAERLGKTKGSIAGVVNRNKSI